MELRNLRSFVVVAEELHFTRAAARLHMSQPTLSHQIGQLERELGVVLLARTKRSVRLTEAGRLFLDRARGVLDDVDAAELEAQRAARGEVGRLTVGLTPAARDLVPATVQAYRASAPGVDIELLQLEPETQIERLTRDEIQLALIHEQVTGPHLASELLRRQPLVVAMAATHPLATETCVTLDQLRHEPFIMASPSAEHASSSHMRALTAAFTEAGYIPTRKGHSTDLATRLAIVAAGLGVTIGPDSNRRLEAEDIAYVTLKPDLHVGLYATWRRNPPSALVSTFLDVLRRNARDCQINGVSGLA